jgi:hypothetical protein
VHCFEAALYSTRSQHLEARYWARPAFQRKRTNIAIIEIPSRELPRVRTNQYGSWFCQGLQSCCEVRRFTYGGLFRRDLTNQQFADNDGTGCNPNPNLQSTAELSTELRYCIDDFQRGMHRLYGTILLRDRIAKIREHTIAHIFWIQTRRQRRRTNEITEQDRQVASLSFTRWLWSWCGRRAC